MLHPSRYFTQTEADHFNREVRENVAKHRASLVAPRPATLPDLPPITDWMEAREARIRLDLMGDPTKSYESACEDHFELCERVRAIEEILPTATPDEKRAILGHEVKVTPSLPGIADTFTHVAGSLEKLKDRIATIERELPLMKMKAARYEQLRKQLEPWPIWKIDKIRNEEVLRAAIVQGKPVQRHGAGRDMSGYTLATE